MTSLQKGFTDELKNSSALPVIGSAANELTDSILSRLNQHVDVPVRLYATATPNSLLNVGPSAVVAGDSANKTVTPINSVVPNLVLSTIDFQTSTATGGTTGGTFTTLGGAFTRPTVALNQYVTLAMVLKSDSSIDTVFSSSSGSPQTNAVIGALFDQLDGTAVGYVILKSTGASNFNFKSSTAATDIIQNADIYRFGSGAGSGAGGDPSFKVQSITTGSVATIKKGRLQLADGRMLYLANDLSVTLIGSGVNSTGITASSGTGNYYLYLDLAYMPSSTSGLVTGEPVYVPATGASGMFIVLTSSPEALNQDLFRYIPLAALLGDGSGGYNLTSFDNYAPRRYQYPSEDSFKIQSVTTPNAVIKGGFLIDKLGREFATYNGSTYGSDITVNLTTILGSSPANASTYYLHIDTSTVSSFTESGTLRKVYRVTQSNLVFSGNGATPDGSSFDRARYIPLGLVRTADTGTAWSGTNSAFRNLALRTADNDDGDVSFRFQNLESVTTATIKAGSIILDSGKELYMASDLLLNLLTGVNNTGITSPAGGSTLYYMYLDLNYLPTVTLVGNKNVYVVTSGTSGMFTILGTDPEHSDLSRYVPLASLVSSGVNQYNNFARLGLRRHQKPSINVSTLVATVLTDRSIGVPGVSDDGFGALALANIGSAPSTSNTSFWDLDTDANDNNGINSRPLTDTNVPDFVGIGFFGREAVAVFNGTDDTLKSTDLFFNVGSVFSYGGWFYLPDVQTNQILMSLSDGASDKTKISFSANALNAEINDGSARAITGTLNFQPNTWHHFVMTVAVGAAIVYIDGQPFAIPSTMGTFVSLTTPVFRISGRRSAMDTPFKGRAQDCFVTKQTLTPQQVLDTYSKRYSGVQVSAGHVLDSDSFPLATTLASKSAFWNLSANLNDGNSGNPNPLVTPGTVPFTGLNIFGAAGAAVLDAASANNYLHLSSTFITTVDIAKRDLAIGAWFALDNWKGENSTAYQLFVQSPSEGFNMYTSSNAGGTGGLRCEQNGGITIDIPLPEATNGSWHHVVIVSAGTLTQIYIDGVMRASATKTTTSMTITDFLIGRYISDVRRLKGRIQDAFFLKDIALSAIDVQRIYATRVDLTGASAQVPVANRKWLASAKDEGSRYVSDYDDSWLIDQTISKLFVNFGDGSSGQKVTLQLQDKVPGTTTAPVRQIDKLLFAAPTSPYAHGLPGRPRNFDFYLVNATVGDGKFKKITESADVSVDDTNFYFDLSAYTIDATHPLNIVAGSAWPQLSVARNFSQNFTPVTITVTGSYTASAGDYIFGDTTISAFSNTLPASPSYGDTVIWADPTGMWSTNTLSILRNGQLINGSALDYDLVTDRKIAIFKFFGGSQGWGVFI